MYHKLARGHTAQFLARTRPHDELSKWAHGPRGKMFYKDFDISTRSKKPGRTVKRLARSLTPIFSTPWIVAWEKNRKEIRTYTYTVSRAVSVSVSSEDARTGFSEEVIFRNELRAWSDEFTNRSGLASHAAITRHAIQRLFERDAMQPEEAPDTVAIALDAARLVAEIVLYNEEYVDGSYSFMIPFLGGALVANNYPIETRIGQDMQQCDTISIRTWLSPEMICAEHAKRMTSLKFALDDEGGVDDTRLRAALRDNARAYDHKTRSQRPMLVAEPA